MPAEKVAQRAKKPVTVSESNQVALLPKIAFIILSGSHEESILALSSSHTLHKDGRQTTQ
jgi:hypothetical protein